MKNLYIADGHHRNASAVKVALKRREAKPDYTGEEEFNYLSVLFAAEDLYIMDYNRVVKDLNGYNTEEFLQEIRKKFDIEPYAGEGPLPPRSTAHLWAVSDGKWFKMTAKEEIITDAPLFWDWMFPFCRRSCWSLCCHRRPQNRQAD